MVKIRLRRIGTKGRPFYRVVVADSKAGRNGSFVETIGIYDPISNPKKIEIKEDRALFWLLQGGQPTETAAYLLNKVGVLERFFAERPAQKKNFSFLDKRTAAISVSAPVSAPVETPAAENS
jgi:small subunit ribosomal protein S16